MIDVIGLRLFIKEFFKNTEINPDNVTVTFELTYRTLKIDFWYRPLMEYCFQEVGYKMIAEEPEIMPTILNQMANELLWRIDRVIRKNEKI